LEIAMREIESVKTSHQISEEHSSSNIERPLANKWTYDSQQHPLFGGGTYNAKYCSSQQNPTIHRDSHREIERSIENRNWASTLSSNHYESETRSLQKERVLHLERNSRGRFSNGEEDNSQLSAPA
jgi:hypothetical protein